MIKRLILQVHSISFTSLLLLIFGTWNGQLFSQEKVPSLLDTNSTDGFVMVRGGTFNMGTPDTKTDHGMMINTISTVP